MEALKNARLIIPFGLRATSADIETGCDCLCLLTSYASTTPSEELEWLRCQRAELERQEALQTPHFAEAMSLDRLLNQMVKVKKQMTMLADTLPVVLKSDQPSWLKMLLASSTNPVIPCIMQVEITAAWIFQLFQ